MSTAAIIYIVLAVTGLIIAASLDGKPMDGKHSFAIRLVKTGLMSVLLFWGGFFGSHV